jgi:hypothetical protein
MERFCIAHSMNISDIVSLRVVGDGTWLAESRLVTVKINSLGAGREAIYPGHCGGKIHFSSPQPRSEEHLGE